MNVGHPPEDHGQVVRAVVQEVEEAEPQRHGSVTQRLQPDELAPLLLPIRPDQRLSLEINPGSEHRLPHWQIQLKIQDKNKFVFMHTNSCEILTLFAM